MKFADFILAHDGDDLAQLALARSRFAAEVDLAGFGGADGAGAGTSGSREKPSQGLATGDSTAGSREEPSQSLTTGDSTAGSREEPSQSLTTGWSTSGSREKPSQGLTTGWSTSGGREKPSQCLATGWSTSGFDLALTTLEVRRKLRDKVPEWYALPSLVYPLRVSGEQCSSTVTARYKAAVAAGAPSETASASLLPLPPASPAGPSRQVGRLSFPPIFPEGTFALTGYGRGWPQVSEGAPSAIADLTGGLGVDTWAFAQVFGEVLYNEMRPELAQAAEANFQELGLSNVVVRNCELVPGNLNEVLDGFRPDVLFLDPARRAYDGRKVFRLEDCQPDVLQLLPELLAACPHVLLKLSPMADITLVCKQLGRVKEVHVVAADGECKELLLLLERDYDGPYSTTIFEDGAIMEIPGQARDEVSFVMADSDRPSFLFEPGKAMMKAGAFDVPGRYGLEKLGKHTHLYVGAEVPAELKPFGKTFRILEVVPLNNRSVKAIGPKYPKADVTARNIPLTSDQLRKKLGVADGAPIHIFGVHVDALKGNYLIITSQ